MRLKDAALKTSDLFQVDPRKITVEDGFNPRDVNHPDTQAHIDWLESSIAEMGVDQPLTVRMDGDRIVLSDGHCRLVAINRLIAKGHEIVAVPCKAEDRHANEADRLLATRIRNGGKPLRPLEEAQLFKRLIGYGWSQADVARKAGLQPSHVSTTLRLLEASVKTQKAVQAGDLSATDAIKEVREKAPRAGGRKAKAKPASPSQLREALTMILKTKTIAEAWSIAEQVLAIGGEEIEDKAA